MRQQLGTYSHQVVNTIPHFQHTVPQQYEHYFSQPLPPYSTHPQTQYFSGFSPHIFTDHSGQLHSSSSSQMTITPGAIRLVDQYGNEVSSVPMFLPQIQSPGGYSYPAPQPQRPSVTQTLPQTLPQKPEPEQLSSPVETQNAYLPPQPQPQIQVHQQPQLIYSQAQYLPPATYHQPAPHLEYLQPQPHITQMTQFQPQPQLIQTQFHQQQPQLIQQFVTAEGHVFHQLVQQPHPQPLPQQEVYHHPQYHYQPQTTVVQEPLQVYHHPIPVETPHPLPVVEKVVPTLVAKSVLPVQEVPTVKLVKQPILTPAVFQKEIFAVKNPAVRVLTYSDLCTVYPYQRKLSACVYKKAAIPELHHPDIQLVPEDINPMTQMPEQTKIVTQTPRPAKPGASHGQGKINPRTNPLRLNAPRTSDTSIQDILAHENKNLDSSTSEESSEGGEVLDDEVPIVDEEENTSVAESSNKNEELVIKTQSKRTSSTPRSKNRKPKQVATKRPTTTSTTPEPSTSTRKSKKSKRRSRNSKARRAERKKKLRDSTSTTPTTTVEELFRLA